MNTPKTTMLRGVSTRVVAGVDSLLCATRSHVARVLVISSFLVSLAGVAAAGAPVTGIAATGASASFAGQDSATAGNWKGAYGSQGSWLEGDSPSHFPTYAQVGAPSPMTWTWVASTTDPRALQKAASATDRLAATWFDAAQFTIDVNLTDGQTHKLSLYSVDWDSTTRGQTIDLLDASTGALLDSRSLSGFNGGRYLSWTVSGHLSVRISHVAGANAVLSGIFLDSGPMPTASASFAGQDSATAGNWKGAYGNQGSWLEGDSPSHFPTYAQIGTPSPMTWTWVASTTDPRALQKAASATDRLAATWFDAAQFTIDVNLTDGQTHKLSLYSVDWDTTTRGQTIDVLDASTGALLDSRSLSGFNGGRYLSWTVSGHLSVRISRVAGANAVLSGMFLDSGTGAATNTPTPTSTSTPTPTRTSTPTSTPTVTSTPTPTGTAGSVSITGLHVQGNQIVNASNQTVRLRGVDRSGTEYMCIGGSSVFDGPSDQLSLNAMKAWHINIVRIPINEDCWLGINGAPGGGLSAAVYRSTIVAFVDLLTANNIASIIDLQWSAPGTTLASGLVPMPDADHAPSFWTAVAGTFKNNQAVIFDLFNEPFPDNNSDSTAAWSCLRSGGTCRGVSYTTVGTQSLVSSIRLAGANNVIIVPGVQYTNSLTGWLANAPTDPQNNLAASWHSYAGQVCSTQACWDANIAPVLARVPLIAGEIGENDCQHVYIDPLMAWLDSHAANYLGWAWNTYDCKSFPSLISNFNGTPTGFGIGLRDHLLAP